MRGRADRALPLGLAAAAFVLAFIQRPGWATSDTKIDLHVDPGRFLTDVASVWTPSGSLGHVQGGQYSGYLFPMGPFFAAGHAIGLAPWVVHRLWLGALLALAAWGTVRLLDDLAGRPRGVAHAVAGAMMLLNPYVVVFTARTSVTLLAYAALPWLLLATRRGLRRPTGWWWPAFFGLVVTSTGGGVNAAVTAWVLLGPVLLVAYEALLRAVAWRSVLAFAWRTAAVTLVVSLWWLGPILVQAAYGIDFLKFTEQQGSIWGTTSMSETLRLMGYWISYIGVGFYGASRAYLSDSATLLFAPVVVAATLLVPAVALGGFARTRREPYAAFFLLLVLAGALVMTIGFPEGTPLRKAANFTYNNVNATHFLRTTYKAGPLVALGLAGLGGLGARALWDWVCARSARGDRDAPVPGAVTTLNAPGTGHPIPPRRGHTAIGLALGAAGLVLLLVAAWPMTRGRALDDQLLWKRVPAAWTQSGRDLDRTLPKETRAVILPGELFAAYRWGETVDSILPTRTDRPVAVRNIVPFADLHAIDAFWAIDAAVGQQRLVPGQLPALVRLLGAGAVLANADGDIRRSGQPPPARSARVLAQQGYGRPARAYGPVRRLLQPAGDIGPAAALAQVRRYDVPATRRIVRVEPDAAPAVVDGSGEGLVGLSAFGALPAGPFEYAGDRSAAQIRRAAASGGDVAISDTNRRRVFVSSRLRQNLGWTLPRDESPSQDAAILDPFADRGTDAQTVAVYSGLRSVTAPFSPGGEQFPEHRPFAALDGDPRTAWLADRRLDKDRAYLDIDFARPRDVPFISLLPENDRYGVVRAVDVNGRLFPVHAGWNRLALGLKGVSGLRIRMARVDFPPHVFEAGAGGLAEVRIPGVNASEALRPPVLAERALAGRDLRHAALTYLFGRTTGDEPFQRARYTGPPQALLTRDRGDGELGLSRVFHPPAARAYAADAWVSPSPDAHDDALDRLAGSSGPVRFDSSSRYQGQARWRASSAFDARPDSEWIGQWVERVPAWISWSSPRPLTVRRLTLTRPSAVVRFPTRVRVVSEAGASPPLAVGADGTVVLPRPVRGRDVRLDILAAAFPRGATAQERTRRAVGIADVRVPGLPAARIRRSGPLAGRCGDVTAALAPGGSVRMRVGGTVGDLDAGTPLRARPCGAPVRLPAATVRLDAPPGVFRIAWLRLRSPAPDPLATAAGSPGRVTDLGHTSAGRHDGVKLALHAPARLVLGESYDRGWRAWCDGHSLGAPEVVDGYANGWRAPASCRSVHFAFAPQRAVVWGYLISALACLLALGFLALRRPGPETRRLPAAAAPADGPAARLSLPAAAAFGFAASLPLAFVFAARTAPAMFVLITLVLWRGIGARPLALAAAGLLALEPVIYLLFLPADKGGFNTNYPVALIGAHWVAVAAVVLLGLALWRTLLGLRPPGPPARTPSRPASAPERPGAGVA